MAENDPQKATRDSLTSLDFEWPGPAQRLDLVLVAQIDGMGRAAAKAWIGDGRVRVEGRRAKKGHLVPPGAAVSVEPGWPAPDFTALADRSVRLSVLQHTADWVVVLKPAGVPMHPLHANEVGTLCSGLLAAFPEMTGVGYSPREPGIVHRLDVGTSGLVLAARSQPVFERLQATLRAGAITKHYHALCAGEPPPPGAITTPIAADPKNARRMVACKSENEVKRLGGLDAQTDVLSGVTLGQDGNLGALSLVEARANTARRHQVRVHLASVGCPLIGDPLYGGPATDGVAHHRLHASLIAFSDPRTGRAVRVASPVPADWGVT